MLFTLALGDSQVRPRPPELKELRDMLKPQQEQLKKLTQSISQLQGSHQRSHSLLRRPIICLCCQQPGHIARKCNGVRVPPRSQPSSVAPPTNQ